MFIICLKTIIICYHTGHDTNNQDGDDDDDDDDDDTDDDDAIMNNDENDAMMKKVQTFKSQQFHKGNISESISMTAHALQASEYEEIICSAIPDLSLKNNKSKYKLETRKAFLNQIIMWFQYLHNIPNHWHNITKNQHLIVSSARHLLKS